jgi:hypothetical protein
MKRAMLLGVLCVAALALVPVASASAFAGTCKIEGTATIYKAGSFTEEQALPLATPAPRNYKFVSSGGKCLPEEGKFEKAEVKGEGELACSISKGGIAVIGGGKGSGSIKISGKEDAISVFAFVGAGADVTFEASGPLVTGLGGVGPATGTASFAKNSKAVTECVQEKASKLEFEALTTGEFK